MSNKKVVKKKVAKKKEAKINTYKIESINHVIEVGTQLHPFWYRDNYKVSGTN